MKRHLPTVVLFAGAILGYALDARSSGHVFLMLGGLAELVAWHRFLLSRH
jgi:uncharacterized membrane protein